MTRRQAKLRPPHHLKIHDTINDLERSRTWSKKENAEEIVQRKKLNFVGVLEPKVAFDSHRLCRMSGFQSVVSNCCNKIWALADENTIMEVSLDTEQLLHLKLTMEQGHVVFCTLVYTKCNKVARKEIWEAMRNIAAAGGVWMMGVI